MVILMIELCADELDAGIISYSCTNTTFDLIYSDHYTNTTNPGSYPDSPVPLLLLRHHFPRRQRSKLTHNLQIPLLCPLALLLERLRQPLKIIDVKRGCICVEELCRLIRRVGKRVRRADRHRYIVAFFGVDDGAVGCVEL